MHSILAPFSGAFTGEEKRRHSKGQLPSTTNNNVVAAARTIWPCLVANDDEFGGECHVLGFCLW